MNGDYGDHTDDLAAVARQPKWQYDYDAEQQQHLDGINGVQIVKMMESQRDGVKQLSPSITPPMSATKHVYPPPEWMRLWLLIGRCHVQFFRDWVSIKRQRWNENMKSGAEYSLIIFLFSIYYALITVAV